MQIRLACLKKVCQLYLRVHMLPDLGVKLIYLFEELVRLNLFDDKTSQSVEVANALYNQINHDKPQTFRKKNELPIRPV